jgi:hypothetical protein
MLLIGCMSVSLCAMDLKKSLNDLKGSHKSSQNIEIFVPHSLRPRIMYVNPEMKVKHIKKHVFKLSHIPTDKQVIYTKFITYVELQEAYRDDLSMHYSLPLKDTDNIREVVYKNGCNKFEVMNADNLNN